MARRVGYSAPAALAGRTRSVLAPAVIQDMMQPTPPAGH